MSAQRPHASLFEWPTLGEGLLGLFEKRAVPCADADVPELLPELPALQRGSAVADASQPQAERPGPDPSDKPGARPDACLMPVQASAAAVQPQPPELPPPTTLKKPGDKPDEAKKEAKDAEAAKPAAEVAKPMVAHVAPPASHWFANRCKGCVAQMYEKKVPVHPVPKELQLTTMPPYVIQTPDILLVESPRALPDQPIAGEHLVRADGTISLGLYGPVRVAGLTIDEARKAIEKHLSAFIQDPKVNVDVYSYNSKFYYIIADNAGYGQQVFKQVFTGNETVLDAMSLIGGLPSVASKKRIWVARPNSHDEKDSLILPVDWGAIVQCGQTATNYQLFPNDRIYIQSDRLQALDGIVAKVLSPVDRILGTTLLMGITTYRWQNLGRQGFNTGASTVISP